MIWKYLLPFLHDQFLSFVLGSETNNHAVTDRMVASPPSFVRMEWVVIECVHVHWYVMPMHVACSRYRGSYHGEICEKLQFKDTPVRPLDSSTEKWDQCQNNRNNRDCQDSLTCTYWFLFSMGSYVLVQSVYLSLTTSATVCDHPNLLVMTWSIARSNVPLSIPSPNCSSETKSSPARPSIYTAQGSFT